MKRHPLVPLFSLLFLLLPPGCGYMKAVTVTVSSSEILGESPYSSARAAHAGQPEGGGTKAQELKACVFEKTTPAPDQALPESAQPLAQNCTARLSIQFDTGGHAIREAYFDELAEFARVMKNHPELCVVIEGHTDNVGSEESNAELSWHRAESVKSRLVSEGIDPSRIEVQGHGQGMPTADNGTEEGRRKNRRVQAEVEYEKSVFLKKKANSAPLSPP
jgi:outer membrane protein OmpA-like peptidoglycan-associated protein